MNNSSRVIFNTGVQYIRTLISVSIGIYSSRIVLDVLGVEEFGVYNLIAGVVIMLSFINASLAVTTKRFLSYYQEHSLTSLREIFNTSLWIHCGLGILLFCIIEIVGMFLFDGFFKIPEESVDAAKVIYHFMSITLFITLLSTPFYALLIAHENILYVSIIQIVDAICKLGIAITISFFEENRLMYYGLLISSIVVVDLICYYIYCHRRYAECKIISVNFFKKKWAFKILRFAGWNIYGSGCMIIRTQGIAVLLNKFFGASINAAFAIALQLQGGISVLSTSILQAIRPQIMRAEGTNDRRKMFYLAELASKFSFFLLSMVVIPCVFEMEMILKIWLKEVPEYTILFCQSVLIAALLDQLTIALGDANQAVGNIKMYTFVIQTAKVLTLPFVMVILLLGYTPIWVMGTYILFEGICSLLRLPLLKKSTGLSIRQFIINVFCREILPFGLFVIITYCISHHLHIAYRFLFTFLISIGIYVLLIYCWGLSKQEKRFFIRLFFKR